MGVLVVAVGQYGKEALRVLAVVAVAQYGMVIGSSQSDSRSFKRISMCAGRGCCL